MPKPTISLKEPAIDNRLLDDRGPTTQRLQKAREAPLNLAHSKGQIDRGQFAAGQKFYGHWSKSWIAERYGSVDLTQLPGNYWRGPTFSEVQEGHEFAFRRALEILKGEKSYVLRHFICHECMLSEIGAAMGYRDRETAFGKALNIARDGLTVLRKEWGIEST